MYSGYHVDNGYIHGPNGCPQNWIDKGQIDGQRSCTQGFIDNGPIFVSIGYAGC
jgi:hypothetical protein